MHWRWVRARYMYQVIECLSSLSVVCLVIALSDCLLSWYSSGHLLINCSPYVLSFFPSFFSIGSVPEFKIGMVQFNLIMHNWLNFVRCCELLTSLAHYSSVAFRTVAHKTITEVFARASVLTQAIFAVVDVCSIILSGEEIYKKKPLLT